MKSKEVGDNKVCIEHPLVHLEEKMQFLKLLHETLVVSPRRVSKHMDHVSRTEEQLRQYEIAIDILREHHQPDA
ncbi:MULTISPECIES: hypothetical protein [Bacillus subtilis group]|uniref:hypothetical protein n=1 Tax=Bacillus subtilis group TaxID=653685 RepID=UPI0011A3A365|nr:MULTISPECIES: hypothetical protein [Bacillus subtilis group]MCY8228724.1 hypothetical protein [Bacillus spizizenii]MCY9056027.1 hypothetical protein [Bacillus spizizenii]MEC2335142.1 hypothetical protein [Bacillus subtilis]